MYGYGGGYYSSSIIGGSYPSSVWGGSASSPASSAPLSATSGGGGGNSGGGANNFNLMPVSGLCDVWADALLGGDGAYAANPSYWYDGIHLSVTGHARQATLI